MHGEDTWSAARGHWGFSKTCSAAFTRADAIGPLPLRTRSRFPAYITILVFGWSNEIRSIIVILILPGSLLPSVCRLELSCICVQLQ